MRRLRATRTPHLTARPAVTVLAEYTPDGGGDLRGAACAGVDGALFFPDPEEQGPAAAAWAERRAKMFCAGCPVKSLCLADALERREPYGVFGGLAADERRKLLRRMARSRTRVNVGGAA
ncbi:WhiB family transcriptional regulator [Kitasatospora sp. NPDC059327]|uniref:WhiB family transcriptional regulator n=1 Tax=Kitasatospora sp. NPDC059327 TaxID=3346803 RepID=UPI0036B06561